MNEGESIEESIKTALLEKNVEVIIADGGSTDGTQARALAAGAKVIQTPPGRAACQNGGAAASRGEIMLFLHGDTILPSGYGDCLRRAHSCPDTSVAAFTLALSPKLPGLEWIEWGANRRSIRLQLPYGDQALSMRREVFDALGGFPKQPFLEDLELMLQARKRGRVVTLPEPVLSSSRRWEKFGVIGNTFRNQLVLIGYRIGVPLERMHLWYYGKAGHFKKDD